MICLLGESSSGKTSVAKELEKLGIRRVVSYTTRPMREGERDGIDYHFMSKDAFLDLIDTGYFAEVSEFNGWFYGTANKDVNGSTGEDMGYLVHVVNPEGLRQLRAKGIDVEPYYIKVLKKERLIKMLNREDNPDINECFRRIMADEEAFIGIEEEAYVIENLHYEKTARQIAEYIR